MSDVEKVYAEFHRAKAANDVARLQALKEALQVRYLPFDQIVKLFKL